MKSREPQLALRLGPEASDADTAGNERWRDGAPIAYLGGQVSLQLDTDRKQAQLEGDTLHLPLPPQASARQIRDAAEAWLRAEAARLLMKHVTHYAAALGRPAPHISLSFSTRSHWIQHIPHATGSLRCNWRLIEQPPGTIESIIARAVANLPAPIAAADLFAACT